MNISIISGSAREGRMSHRVAIALAKAFEGKGLEVSVIDVKGLGIGIMDDVLAKQANPSFNLIETKRQLDAADAMIFVSPEYNGSYSPALKNLIDHFPKSTYERKPIGVAAVSSGAMGGIRAALQLQQLVLALFGYPTFRMLTVPNVSENLNEVGEVLTPAFQKTLDGFVAEFEWFSSALVTAKNK